jgi:glutamate transport system substrate-binding protein
MRRARWMLTALLALSLFAAACSSDDGGGGAASGGQAQSGAGGTAGGTVASVKAADKLIVGTKFDQPLFGLKNLSGQVEGFDVEIAKEIGKALLGDPNKVEFVEAVTKNREPFLMEGKVDIVVATYTINDERKQKVDFAGPYYEAGQDVMVKADNSSITKVEDLNGKKVCSVQGSTSEKNLPNFAPDAELTLFDTYSKCADALGDGRVEAVTTDNVILLGLVDQSKGAYKLVNNPFTKEPYGIGTRKGSDLRQFINDELDKMFTDGRWAAAWERTAGKAAGATPAPPAIDRY